MIDKMKSLFSFPKAQAHCDIPCGIYDTGPALIAALSVVRMLDVIKEVTDNQDMGDAQKSNKLARSIALKEEEAEKVKHEVRIIWGDYFKAPHFDSYPELHGLVHSIMMKGSACKQGVSRDDGVALVELVNQFAEIFWATKNVKTVKKTAPYAPALEVVYPDL